MSSEFRLLMIAAMYENGGNTTHRFFDGHPQMFVYPFESQIGTRHVSDHLTSMFPVKYRWPEFSLDAEPEDDFRAIIDEEAKVRARTPNVSKFRHVEFDLDDDERASIYAQRVRGSERSRGENVAAFFEATFQAWRNHRSTGEECVYVGYSPIIGIDGAKILDDLPHAHVLHVVRNPWSAYADTKKRPVPLRLDHYLLGWTLNQYFALLLRDRYPGRFQIVRAEDVMSNPIEVLGEVCERLGLKPSDTLGYPSWNGDRLGEVYPWGTIRTPTPSSNAATARELSSDERDVIRDHCWQYLDIFNYVDFP